MRRLAVVLIVLGLTVSSNAYAWFFFFIPASVSRAVADSITGAKGNICVKEGTQVGQILPSGNGNTAKVLSLSGTSSICPNPALPIRAELEFTYNFSPKAGVDLPDDFQARKLTDLEVFNGWLLIATSKGTKNHGIFIFATSKKANLSLETMANNMERTFLNNKKLKDVVSARTEKLIIDGMPAVRFEISATASGIFGQRATYQHTIIEGDNEIVIVDVYAPLEHMESNRLELQKIAEHVSGLHAAEQGAITIPHAVPVTPTLTASPSALTLPTTAPVVATAADKSALVEQRLQRLNKLLKDGVITESEFAGKKQEILKDL